MRPETISGQPVHPFLPSSEKTGAKPPSISPLPNETYESVPPNSAEQWLAQLFAAQRLSQPAERGSTSAAQSQDQSITRLKEIFQQRFSAVAGDKEKFHELMREAYGANYDKAAAESLRQRSVAGDYSWLPSVEFRDDKTLRGGNGAYDGAQNRIFINERFRNDPGRAAAIYSEEVGHALDARLNKRDTIGDEGEMFRRLLAGEKLTAGERTAIQNDQDHGVIYVDGKRTEVEYSIFDDIWNGAKKVGGALVDGAKWVGGKIADGVEWVAPRIVDGIDSLATGAVSTVRGAALNMWEGVTTFGSGFGKLFTGDVGGALKDWGSGLVKVFVQTPVDGILMMGGRTISAIQTLVGLEPPGRRLTEAEIGELRKVYGDSIDYSRVKIKEGSSGLFSLTDRPFTHGDTIYVPSPSLPLPSDVLVHEMGHVWQHQHGGTDYMSEALWAQNFGEGYDFERGIREGKSWGELNPEQQAELLQTAYRSGFFDNPGGRFTYNGTDYTDYLNNALRQIHSGDGAP